MDEDLIFVGKSGFNIATEFVTDVSSPFKDAFEVSFYSNLSTIKITN